MASWHKRTRRHKNMGRKRKNAESKHSTPGYDELFAALGEPGKPAPKGVAQGVAKVAKAAPARASK
jgi:hypothetical protein